MVDFGKYFYGKPLSGHKYYCYMCNDNIAVYDSLCNSYEDYVDCYTDKIMSYGEDKVKLLTIEIPHEESPTLDKALKKATEIFNK